MWLLRPRHALVCLLLAVVPFGGVRVVCVDAPASAAQEVEDRPTSEDCTEFCAISAAPGNETRCAFSSGTLSLVLVACDALLRPIVAVSVSRWVPHVYLDARTIYDAPALARVIPPPEA